MIETNRRSNLDEFGDFYHLTEGQFGQIVKVLENLYKKRPESFLETMKKLLTKKTTLTELSNEFDNFEKQARRVNVIANIGDEAATYQTLRTALECCAEENSFPLALQKFHQRISSYHDSNKTIDIGIQNRFGRLAVKICMEQKHNYW